MRLGLVFILGWFLCLPVGALDLTNGLMFAVPTPGGKAPTFTGNDADWDLSGAEPMWVAPQTAKQLHAVLAVEYDDQNLYVYARSTLLNGQLSNPNGPTERFWFGNEIELRLCSDPSLPYPLDIHAPASRDSNRVCSMCFWKNTNDGKDYMVRGIQNGPEKGNTVDLPGSKVVLTRRGDEYVMEAKVPWSVLNVPDGKNPFKPGMRMTAIWGVHWGGEMQYAALYTANPGAFAFYGWGAWGQIEFSPTGDLKPHHPTMEEALATPVVTAVGVPITVDVPEAGKISVNIFGEHGEVIRELTGGQSVPAGKFTIYWDGRDQWGFALKPGPYRWGAYFSHGLKARYVGFVGTTANPPYQTLDNKGGWGGDLGTPSAVAADASGIYLGWKFAETQRQIVKVDYAGKVIWRKIPFVTGGTSTLHALATNGKYLFVVYDGEHPILMRFDVATGGPALFSNVPGQGASVPIAAGTPILAPEGSLPAADGFHAYPDRLKPGDYREPECIGLAATPGEVFASVYSQNIIQVLSAETGAQTRTLACPRPRGLALDPAGNLYAVCYGTDQAAEVVRFDGAKGEAKPVVTGGLVAPVGVAVDAAGEIVVADEGTSQQIKTFSPDGKILRTLGKEGGRGWAGKYDPSGYRDPSAITADAQGGLVVAESSIPKIFDRIDAASGKTLARWFGWTSGGGFSNVGDCDNPMTSYFPYIPEGFGRATVTTEGQTAPVDTYAYWVMPRTDTEGVGTMYDQADMPYIIRLANGRKYFISDRNPHAVCLIKGDQFLPVGNLDVDSPWDHRQPNGQPSKDPTTVTVWIDRNGDHKIGADETTKLASIGGKPLPVISTMSYSLWLDPDGNAYLVTWDNKILKIPAEGFAANGAILWNPAKASYVGSPLLPSLLDRFFTGYRTGFWLRTDSKDNIYACITTVLPSLTPELAARIKAMYPDIPPEQWCVYADADIAKRMHEGLSHSGESNAVKIAKYGPDGKLLWIAGRKATAAPNPGEMYHFWAIAGLVDDNYVAGASEWGPIYFYTHDGFYVDSIMEDPASLPPPGPYTFGSETFSGRVQAFDNLGKVYAYSQGGIYAVDGFDPDLKVSGERRLSGTVQLDKIYAGVEQSTVAAQLQIVPISGDITQEATWSSAPTVTLTRAGGKLATAQVAYDAQNLYARFHVADDTPLQNSADDINVVFKGGDVVGLDLGPAGDRNKPVLGDVRILAASVHGQPRLIGMKPVSQQAKQPQVYTTPAAGNKPFDFVGEIPGGTVTLTPDADGKGYTALMTVPRSFLEFPITPGTKLMGDVEVLLSGMGARGLQAVSRNWLNSGGHMETTMVDDIPTEAWLYPQFWGGVEVK